MSTMEFEEMQKIWDAQNKQPLWVIDEQALHNRILAKKRQGNRIANITEWLLIIINFSSGIFILCINLLKPHANIFIHVLTAWMFFTGLYVLVSRLKRISGGQRFDRSMRGDLHHAIAVAGYQVRFSQIMRWNILPIGLLSLLSTWQGERFLWIAIFIVIVFSLSWYASRWEHNMYKSRKRELEVLQSKLEAQD